MNNNEFVIKETKKFLIFDYEDNNIVNNLLNNWYQNDKLIVISKKDNKIIIKLERDDYEICNDVVSLNDDLNKIIDLFHISDNVRINIKKKDMKLYSNSYKNIFDNILIKDKDCYLFDINREEELYKEISKYNKYTSMNDYKNVDKVFNDFDINDIENCFNKGLNSLMVIKKDKMIELYIDGDNKFLFNFRDKNMFNNIYIPEILKFYSNKYNVEVSYIDRQFNKYFGVINDNFYFINFSLEEIEGYIKYIDNESKKNNYKLDLESNYTFIKKDEENIKLEYSYSYGYASIIFISLVISIITMIVTFMHLK